MILIGMALADRFIGMNSTLRHSALFLVLVLSSCAGGMGTTGGSPLGTTEKGGEEDVPQGEIGVQDQISAPVQEQFAGSGPASPVSAIGQGSLAPGLEPPAGPTATTSPTGQIFGIPITAGGGVSSATPTDVPVDEEGEGTSATEPEISYHYSTAAPAEEVLPTLPVAPSLDANPIVVCAPDTICYDTKPFEFDSGCSYEKMKEEEVSVEMIKALPSKEIFLLGKIVTEGKKDLNRQCTVEISQDGEPIKNLGTNYNGVFGIFIRDFDSRKVSREGEERRIATFELRVYSTDEEPVPLGEPTAVELELPLFERDIIKDVPKKLLPMLKPPVKETSKPSKKPVIVPLKTTLPLQHRP